MSESRANFITSLFILLQHLVPHHLLSRLTGWLAANTTPWLKNLLIRQFIKAFKVNMEEAAQSDPRAYPHFNAFFTRSLVDGARPIVEGEGTIASPADGAVSQMGRIEVGCLMQAKNHWYSAAELLADDELARRFHAGSFATVYLSPRDYHRVHMPTDARLVETRYVPGRLFSVNQATAENVERLFARNERLVCIFETAHGPMAMVLVGAMIVAGIETVWGGQVTPAGRSIQQAGFGADARQVSLEKGAEMGRFQLGSTVILLFPEGVVEWNEALGAGTALQLGQEIGRFT